MVLGTTLSSFRRHGDENLVTAIFEVEFFRRFKLSDITKCPRTCQIRTIYDLTSSTSKSITLFPKQPGLITVILALKWVSTSNLCYPT